MNNKDNDGRPNPFELLSKFKPKDGDRAPVLSADIDRLSADNDFPSREASVSDHEPVKMKRFRDLNPPKAQLNFRAEVTDRERFYELAQQHGYQKLGDLFKHCLDAFEEKKRT